MTEQPPGDPYGRPTEPLPPPPGRPVTREEVVVDDYPMTKAELAERIDRTRFWSQFGAAAGTLAAILAVIAIVLALQAKDDADNAGNGSNAGLRSEVNQLQEDVNTLQRQQSENSQQLDDLQSDVNSVERQVGNASDEGPSQEEFDQLQQQVSDLNDTVDQLQRDLESATGGDGGSP
jgi:septal ring factor EnvC (AmiA/AmiB activator)